MGERTKEEWGRVAAEIPGWRHMPGMRRIGILFWGEVRETDPVRIFRTDSREEYYARVGADMIEDFRDAIQRLVPGVQLRVAPYDGGMYGYVDEQDTPSEDPDDDEDGYYAIGHAGGGAVVVDPDDPATAGCLLALLCGPIQHPFVCRDFYGQTESIADAVVVSNGTDSMWSVWIEGDSDHRSRISMKIASDPSLGRACIAAAEALGRWPGDGAC